MQWPISQPRIVSLQIRILSIQITWLVTLQPVPVEWYPLQGLCPRLDAFTFPMFLLTTSKASFLWCLLVYFPLHLGVGGQTSSPVLLSSLQRSSTATLIGVPGSPWPCPSRSTSITQPFRVYPIPGPWLISQTERGKPIGIHTHRSPMAPSSMSRLFPLGDLGGAKSRPSSVYSHSSH